MAKKVEMDETPAESEEKLTIAELAKRHGQIQPAPIAGDDPYSADHNIAAVLNGWNWHMLHVFAGVTMTSQNYLAAIEAAKLGKPHAPANLKPEQGGTK